MSTPSKGIGTCVLWAEKRPGVSWQILDYSSWCFRSLQAAQRFHIPQQALNAVCCSGDFPGSSFFWEIFPSHGLQGSEAHHHLQQVYLAKKPLLSHPLHAHFWVSVPALLTQQSDSAERHSSKWQPSLATDWLQHGWGAMLAASDRWMQSLRTCNDAERMGPKMHSSRFPFLDSTWAITLSCHSWQKVALCRVLLWPFCSRKSISNL